MEAFVIVEVASQRVALPASDVEQVLRMVALTGVPRATRGLAGVVDLHGELVPVVELRSWLGAAPRAPAPDDHLVVVRRNGRRVALHADRVTDLAVVDRADIVAGGAWSGHGTSAAVRLSDGVAMVPFLDDLLASAQDATAP